MMACICCLIQIKCHWIADLYVDVLKLKPRLPSFVDLQFQRCCFSFMINKNMEKEKEEEYSKICHDVVQRLMKLNEIDDIYFDGFGYCHIKRDHFYCNLFYIDSVGPHYLCLPKCLSKCLSKSKCLPKVVTVGSIEKFLIDFAIDKHVTISFFNNKQYHMFIPKIKSLEELFIWLDLNEGK